jgi:hypothetical protein
MLMLGLTIATGITQAQQTPPHSVTESQLVGRLYALTYDGREMCEKVGPEEAAQFKRELKRFLTAYPELMQRLE